MYLALCYNADMSEKVRVRVAPSPTGYVHVGNTYIAYYNYIFAKQQGGTFIVRLDDTDVDRHVEDAEQVVYDLWHWFGLEWQEGSDIGGPYAPYKQSERIDRYREVADMLVAEGKGYHHENAIFLRVSEGSPIVVHDTLRGDITFERENLKDMVMIKSNGYPTYQFATVIDEIDHEITHVIRGEDHLSNTPTQQLVYEALGEIPPRFTHLPLLRNPDHSKLSKRSSHTSLGWYREQGFLPEALKNFFALMGWSHPEGKEVFDESEFIEKFDINRVNKTAPVFDLTKLEWLNGQYIRALTVTELAGKILEHATVYAPACQQQAEEDYEYFEKVVGLEQERLTTLAEFWEKTPYFFTPDVSVNREDVKEFFEDERALRGFVDEAVSRLGALSEWEYEVIEATLRELQKQQDLKPKQAFMTLRLIVTGQKATPSLFHLLEVLPKDWVLNRLTTFRTNP